MNEKIKSKREFNTNLTESKAEKGSIKFVCGNSHQQISFNQPYFREIYVSKNYTTTEHCNIYFCNVLTKIIEDMAVLLARTPYFAQINTV